MIIKDMRVLNNPAYPRLNWAVGAMSNAARAVKKGSSIVSYQFSPAEQEIAYDEMRRVASRFGANHVALPALKAQTLANEFKTPRSAFELVMLTLLNAQLIWEGSQLKFFGIGMAIAYGGIHLSFLLSGGCYKSVKKIRSGLPELFINPWDRANNTLRFLVAHEMVHHLKHEGIIQDDSIANAVACVRLMEQGLILPKYSAKAFDKTWQSLERGEKGKVFNHLREKGHGYREKKRWEMLSAVYEFGDMLGAIAWWLGQQRTIDDAWTYLRAVAHGDDPREMFFSVMNAHD